MRTAMIALTMTGFILSPAAAAPLQIQEKVVEAGKLQKIGQFISMDPECHLLPGMAISVLEGPTKGTISMEMVKGYPSYPSFNPRSRCNTRKVPAQAIFYRPLPSAGGGEDSFAIEAIDNMGTPHRYRFHVTIRDAEMPRPPVSRPLRPSRPPHNAAPHNTAPHIPAPHITHV